jgi:hypothetical protein
MPFNSDSAKAAKAKAKGRGENKEKKELKEMMAERFPDYHPVIAMAEIANDELNDVDIRLTAHKEVSKYVAPQLKAIEISGSLATQVIRIAKIKK